jgi:hypothetical protein
MDDGHFNYIRTNKQTKMKINKQVAHCVIAMPDVIWPWSIFYFKGQLLKKENKESLAIYIFLKLNIQN